MQIEDVFKNVRAEVVKQSNGIQTPWESSSLIGDFYFYPENVAIASTTATNEPAAEININEEITAEWKATGLSYWLYLNGVDISKETKSKSQGKSLVVTHAISGTKFLLKDFWNHRDGQMRSAVILEQPSLPQVSYKSAPARVNRSGNPLDKINAVDRPVPYTPATKVKLFWRATSDNKYFLLVNGTDISRETNHKLVGDDLYVFHSQSGRLFLLKGFTYRRDNRNRKAILVK